jgi:hypothetical protein
MVVYYSSFWSWCSILLLLSLLLRGCLLLTLFTWFHITHIKTIIRQMITCRCLFIALSIRSTINHSISSNILIDSLFKWVNVPGEIGWSKSNIIFGNKLSYHSLSITSIRDWNFWGSCGCVRGVNSHGVNSFKGQLLSLVFGLYHFSPGDFCLTADLLQFQSQISCFILKSRHFQSIFLSLIKQFLL